jgi:hypothetical protein
MMQSDTPTTCHKCGREIPPGLNFRRTPEGDRCFGKCSGNLRKEKEERRLQYMHAEMDELIKLIRTGTQSEFMDAEHELKRRDSEFLEAVRHVLNYMYDTEADHYEECSDDERQNHIFPHVQTMKRFLDGRESPEPAGFETSILHVFDTIPKPGEQS